MVSAQAARVRAEAGMRPSAAFLLLVLALLGEGLLGVRALAGAKVPVGQHGEAASLVGLGRPVSARDAGSALVFPDGTGLPSGRGSVELGKEVFVRACAACHGSRGEGGTADALSGAEMALDSATPDKVIGNYWPYAATLFDFIQRAMPLSAPKSLSTDEVYAVTAYLLFLNGLLEAGATLDAASLAAIEMPNRDGFIWIDVPSESMPP